MYTFSNNWQNGRKNEQNCVLELNKYDRDM